MVAGEAAGRDRAAPAPQASQSLYRKYRPTSFDETDLVGQEHVSRTLRNAVRHGRVAHAYLFCGPRGCGKTTTARLLAKAVNCEAPDPADRPCNACPSCRAINEGRAVDIVEIDAASNRGIDDIRDLREKVRFAPAQLGTKFYIVDEVHQLTEAAANALLKTLEEPPPHAAFVLATTDPEKVPETITSRCQTFVFHRIPIDRMIARLRLVCDAEGLRADDAALAAIARAATGSLRDALGLLDQLAAYGDEGITAEAVRQVLGAGAGEQVTALVDALAAGDVAAGLRAINAVVESGADARQFAAQVVEYLRALLLALAQGGRGPAPEAAPGVAGAQEHLAAFTLAEAAGLVKRFSQVDYGLKHSVYGHLPLELCFVECALARGAGSEASAAAAPPPARPATEPVAAPQRRPWREAESAARPRRDVAAPPAPEIPPPPDPLPDPPRAAVPERSPTPPAEPESSVARATAPEPAPAPPAGESPPMAAAPAPAVSLADVQDRWPELRQHVKAVNRRIEAILSSVDPLAVTDDQVTLVASYEFHRNKLNEDDARRTVEEVIARLFGAPYRVVCLSREEAAALGPPANPPPGPRPDGAGVVPLPPAPRRVRENGNVGGIGPAREARAPAADPADGHTAGSSGSADDEDERFLGAVRNMFNAVEIKE
ncbi:MAG TPA: DNA polymerase III subunit gamma/tau [Thermomicrobiales bacterium]|nr:DNA polymerase III subunit gamma/tau [Thermomicrobiales bacterium]